MALKTMYATAIAAAFATFALAGGIQASETVARHFRLESRVSAVADKMDAVLARQIRTISR